MAAAMAPRIFKKKLYTANCPKHLKVYVYQNLSLMKKGRNLGGLLKNFLSVSNSHELPVVLIIV